MAVPETDGDRALRPARDSPKPLRTNQFLHGERKARFLRSPSRPFDGISDMELAQELRHAARRLARTPSFTVIALATLSLAIGATTTVFSLLNGVLLKPLEFAHPDRLVFLHDVSGTGGDEPISPQDLADYGAQTHSFADVV